MTTMDARTVLRQVAATLAYRAAKVLRDRPDLIGDLPPRSELVRQARASGIDTTFVMVTAFASMDTAVEALRAGAADYMVKPVGLRELVARIKAVSRRASAPKLDPMATQQIGPIEIDRRKHVVSVAGEEIYLTPKEFALLAYLATDPGAVFRRKDLLGEVWGTEWYVTPKTVDAHVASLRKKLGHQDWIEAVRGVGFRLDVATP